MAFRSVDPGVQHLWDQLEDEEQAIKVERRRLQEIWTKISAMHRRNAEAREAFEKEATFDFVSGDKQIVLNIGGQKFQTTAGVLCRDRFSLLASICTTTPPIAPDESGEFFFERDWWIFRYVLQFLRTGDLPSDQALLREMYGEAIFYRLNSLRRAIQRRSAATAVADNTTPTPAGAAPSRQRKDSGSNSSDPALLRSTEVRAAAPLGQQQQEPETRKDSLFREALPDPYGFTRKHL
ncbi:unnamed protein product [Scytosiphon promiscuus]